MVDEVPEGRRAPAQRRSLFHRQRMEYWAFVAQIASAIGVIISLVFVGIQLRDSNRLAVRTEQNTAQSQWSAFRNSIYASHDTASLFQKGMAGSAMDPADHLRFLYIMREHAWATYQIWDRANDGLVPMWNFTSSAAHDYLRVICTPGGAPAWKTIKVELPPPYVTEIDRIAVDYAKVHAVRCLPVR